MEEKNKKRKEASDANTEEVEVMIPKSKFRKYDKAMQEDEAKLEEILFGGNSALVEKLEKATTQAPETCIDSGFSETESEDRKPAWIDEDDCIQVGNALDKQKRKLPDGGINSRSNTYANLLQEKFTSIVGQPKWASLDKQKQIQDADSDDEILKTAGLTKKQVKGKLKATTIEIKKVNNLNCETYSEGPNINCVEFHPTSTVSLVAGQSGVASIYAVDGQRNNKLHSIKFEKFPIFSAQFISGGNEAVLGSRYPHMYLYDLVKAKATKIPLATGMSQMKKFIVSPDGKYLMVAGKWGEIHAISAQTRERLFMLKQDGEVTAISFNPESNMMLSHSDSGEVTVWDMNNRRARHKFEDDGCLQGTSLAISPSNQFLACGSAQGVVNIYDLEKALKEKTPTPRKTIMNLTTAINSIKFNSTSECLVFHSSAIENSVRLFHLQSQTVFSNFPNFQTKLGCVNVANFSPNSGYLALANAKSTVSLFRLKHFNSY